MRVGIVGTGFMGRTHAAAWQTSPADLVGFVSQSVDAAREAADEFGGRSFESLADLLGHVDVVDICTPTHLHREMVLTAAAAGKAIVCEKPLARTLDDARDMIASCDAAGVKLLVAHVVRFFPEYAAARAQVAAGEIGRPAVVRLKRGTFQPKKAVGNWFLDFEKSGGMMLDLMIHDFDYARWVAGEVDTVYARSIRATDPDARVDHGLVILTHRDGAITHVEGSWAYPPPLFRTRLEIAGENGWMRYDSTENSALSIHLHEEVGQSAAPDVPLPGSPLLTDPYAVQIQEFYNHLAYGTPVRVTARDGLAALEIALAALESAATDQPVSLLGV